MTNIQFRTKSGELVSFKAKKRSRSRATKKSRSPSKSTKWTRLIKRLSKSRPKLKGPALFKAASKLYKA